MQFKEFNVTGNCVKTKHYMVDTGEKLNKIKEMVDKGDYFTINRARQYGKTTTLYLLRDMLKHEYICLKISFEGVGEAMFSSEEAFCRSFLCELDIVTKKDYPDAGIAWKCEAITGFRELNTHISVICQNRKVVLLVDEVDKSSNNQIFLHFLGVLRNKYLARNGGDGHTFHSVILAGVNDIRNIKQKMVTGGTYALGTGEGIYNSPWNIAADFDVDMSFNPAEIETMLAEYENEHGSGMNTAEIAEEIYAYTSGYPFLVSRLCLIIDKKLNKNWTVDGVKEAVDILLDERNTLFDDIFKNIENNPKLSELIYDIMILGIERTFKFYDPTTSLGEMYGIFKKKGRQIAVSNRIFEILIVEHFILKEQESRDKKSTAIKEDVVEDGKFDMEACLRKFAQHYYEIYNEMDADFLERHGRLLFLSFLKPLINGVGFYYIEAETRNARRMDIILDYNKEQFIIELKLWYGDKYKEKAYAQLLDYMAAKNMDTGYLITFDFRKDVNKERKTEWVNFDGTKRIFDVVI
jgi:flavodoxin